MRVGTEREIGGGGRGERGLDFGVKFLMWSEVDVLLRMQVVGWLRDRAQIVCLLEDSLPDSRAEVVFFEIPSVYNMNAEEGLF